MSSDNMQKGLSKTQKDIWAIIHVSANPVSLEAIRTRLNLSEREFNSCMEDIKRYLEDQTCFMLQEIEDSVTLVTKPEHAPAIKTVLDPPLPKLSEEALEVVSIIAYRQPIAKSEIDAMRGVDSEKTLLTLHRRGLIMSRAVTSLPGQPLKYMTTQGFLQYFGLKDLSEMPALSKTDAKKAEASIAGNNMILSPLHQERDQI